MPQQTALWRRIAKDYQPKEAEMKICRYIEELEGRIVALEQHMNAHEMSLQAVENLRVNLNQKIAEIAASAIPATPAPTTTRRSKKTVEGE
jgi:hypothetical protein